MINIKSFRKIKNPVRFPWKLVLLLVVKNPTWKMVNSPWL